MLKKKQPLKTGEKILFGIFGAFIVMAVIAYAILEYVRFNADTPMFENLTHFNFSPEGHKGAILFRIKRCTSCHRAMMNGTNMGLSLDGIGSLRDLAWIEDYLDKPVRAQRATYDSVTFDHGPGKEADYVSKLPKEERFYIATFLSQLRSDQGASSSPLPPKGPSPFIDAMIDSWAPKEWSEKYTDIRETERYTGKKAKESEAKDAVAKDTNASDDSE